MDVSGIDELKEAVFQKKLSHADAQADYYYYYYYPKTLTNIGICMCMDMDLAVCKVIPIETCFIERRRGAFA